MKKSYEIARNLLLYFVNRAVNEDQNTHTISKYLVDFLATNGSFTSHNTIFPINTLFFRGLDLQDCIYDSDLETELGFTVDFPEFEIVLIVCFVSDYSFVRNSLNSNICSVKYYEIIAVRKNCYYLDAGNYSQRFYTIASLVEAINTKGIELA